MKKPFLLACVCTLALAACLPSVDRDGDDPLGLVVVDLDRGIVPLPFDLLKNPATGLMAFPIGESDPPLSKELYTNMNLLDGYITGMVIGVPFDFEIAPETLTPANVRLFLLNGETGVELVAPESYYLVFNLWERDPAAALGWSRRTEPPFKLTIVNRPPGPFAFPVPWKTGGRYALVLGPAVAGSRAGQPVTLGGHVLFHLLKSTEPVVQLEQGVLTMQTDLLGDPKDPTILGAGINLENMRKLLAQKLFDATPAVLARADAPVVIPFSIKSNPEAVFLPGTTLGNILPGPNELLGGAAPAADMVTLTALVDAPLKASTVNDQTFRLFSFDTLDPVALNVPAPTFEGAGPTHPITATPAAPLAAGTRYVAVLTKSITDEAGTGLSASSYFGLVRARNRLIDDNDEFGAAIIEENVISTLALTSGGAGELSTVNENKMNSARGLLVSTIRSMEELRAGYADVLDRLEREPVGLAREDIVALWAFTTAE